MKSAAALLGLLVITPLVIGSPATAQVPEDSAACAQLRAEGLACTEEEFLNRAARGDTDELRLFLQSDIDLEAKDEEGRTALQLASEQGHWDAVKLLAAAGANVRPAMEPRLRHEEDKSSYHVFLAFLSSVSGVLIAVVGGIFTFLYNRRQHDLHLLEATEKMIPHLAEPEQDGRANGESQPPKKGRQLKNSHGTPHVNQERRPSNSQGTKEAALITLMALARSNRLILSLADLYPGRASALACLEILKKKGRSTDLPRVRRALFSCLYTAAGEIGERGVIELLAERLPQDELQAILNETDPQGRTAVMNAARHNRGGNIQKLAGLGARIDIVDDGGETALHHAARYGQRQATKVLVDLTGEPDEKRSAFLDDKDAFLSQPNLRDGWTALDLALYHQGRPPDPERAAHYATVVKRLERAGVAHGPGRPCDDGLSTAPAARARDPRRG